MGGPLLALLEKKEIHPGYIAGAETVCKVVLSLNGCYSFHAEVLRLQRKRKEMWLLHRASFEARIGGRQSDGERRGHTGALD